MEKGKTVIVVDIETRKVEYFPEKGTYMKTFKPKLQNKFKFWFKTRKYPGENFKYISEELRKIDVKSVQVKSYDKYFVETEEIKGVTMENFLISSSKKETEEIMGQFVDYVIKIINAGIYFGDFKYSNFMVDSNQNLIAIDLEGYKKDMFNINGPSASFRRLKRHIQEKEILEKIKNGIKVKDKFYQKK